MNTDIQVLTDKTVPWDLNKVKLLEQAIIFFYSNPSNPNSAQISQILVQLKEDPDMWLAADTILENATDSYTKFFALQTLEQVILSKWKILPEDQKNAIKSYIVTLVVKMGANKTDKSFQHVLSKANMLLIGIVKHEWNTTWRSFIPDICESSKQDQNVCENNLEILRMLSEEIFDHSKNQITSSQIKELKETMHNEFGSIYQLCHFVMKGYVDNPQQVRLSLIETCLNTLHAFLSWIPLGYLFLTDLLDMLLQIFDNKDLKLACLKCLMEIVVLEVDSTEEGKNIKEKTFMLYTNFTVKLNNFIPAEASLLQERNKLASQKNQGLTHFDNFCQGLSLFLAGFMRTHIRWIEVIANDGSNQNQMMTIELIKKGFQYMVHLTELPGQIFKICLEFWNDFTSTLLFKNLKPSTSFSNEPLLLLNMQPSITIYSAVYEPALVQIRNIVISRMAKPIEALLVIDETGRPVRQNVKNTENNSLYDVMKDLLINLAKLDWGNTKSIMTSKLDNQLNGSEWSFDNLNSLSWAIGSINGTAAINEEKSFLVYIISGLLQLVEQKKDKESKAVVASDIMYVVGQYPRFLKSSWNFLKTVVRKLLEFMHEPYPGVMEMAVNTLLKIAENCKEDFVVIHKSKDTNNQETVPYIEELIRTTPQETDMLEPEHKLIFYEAIGQMISGEPNAERKQYLLGGVLQDYWAVWDGVLQQIQINMDCLRDEKVIENFQFIIRVHERLAFSLRADFYKAMARIYMDLLKLYVLYSNLISSEINSNPNPQYALNHYLVRKIRGVKKEVLNLMITVVERSNDLSIVAQNFIVPLMDVLQDYRNNIPEVREPEVLSLFTVIVGKLKDSVANLVPQILQYVFEATINMITTDFNSNIDHRVNLFKLLLAITGNCFQALFTIPPEQFKNVIDCIIWAIKHELPAIFESGLEALILILENVDKDPNVANQFYQCYYMSILQDVLFVTTDGFHKSGFKQQAILLSMLFQEVYADQITVPLAEGQNITNKEYVYQYVVDQLSKSFNTLSKTQTGQYIAQLFNLSTDFDEFKVLMRDYLIKLSQYDPEGVDEGQLQGSDLE